METKIKTVSKPDRAVNILLVGNNPIELSNMRDVLQRIPGHRVMAEIAFDLRSIWQRLLRFSPNFILIDDNIGKQELSETVSILSTNRKTKDVPITVLKNSNFEEALTSSEILDYVLKKNLTGEALFSTLKNSLKFRRTRRYLAEAYSKRKREFLKLVR
jgi:DNA-binding NarL/FixJ family response regulator